MLIPVRCVTCGKVLADKWRYYETKIAELKDRGDEDRGDEDRRDEDAARTGLVGQKLGAVLDDMGISKMCCRRHLLSTVDAMHRI